MKEKDILPVMAVIYSLFCKSWILAICLFFYWYFSILIYCVIIFNDNEIGFKKTDEATENTFSMACLALFAFCCARILTVVLIPLLISAIFK